VNFLNPLFLFGLFAAAIPILIHLFTRRRPREVRFPSLEFLAEVNQSEIRRLRLKQWLLLALRTLAIAAIALAMARPAVRGSAGPRGTAATTVVALVDRSGSMGAAAPEGGALIGGARRVVEDLLGTLGPADEMLLVPYDRAPRPVTPRPSADVPRLRAAAQALAAGADATDHDRALAFAARALAESRSLNRELFWIGDFQASGFGGEAAVAAPSGPWDAARVYLVPLAPRSRANAALTDAALAPSDAAAALTVTGAGFDAAPGDAAIAVRDRAGEIGRGYLALPGRGEASALLPLARMPEDGGWVELPGDALALDNRRAFAAGRSGTVRVLLREDGPPSALRLALEAGSPASGIAVEPVAAAALPARLADADVLVVHDVAQPGPVETQAILDWSRGGGAVLLVPGRRAEPAAWGTLLGPLGAGTLGAMIEAPAGAAWRLQRAVAGHPVLAGFPARPGEPLSSARFAAIRAFTPAPESRTLLEFERRRPALVEASRAMVLLAPIDPAASDLVVSGAFLPLLHQSVKVLGRGTAAPSLLPGERYQAPAGTGAWRIEDEDGREVPSELSAAAGTIRLVSEPLERPGLYRVLQGGRPRASFAVNPDPRESDLAPAPEAALVRAFPPGRARIVPPGADLARRVREARYGRELWSWFVIAALVLLAAESVLGRAGTGGARRAA
jgi:hypothetical protein